MGYDNIGGCGREVVASKYRVGQQWWRARIFNLGRRWQEPASKIGIQQSSSG
jgi:hypothetical protein